MSYPKYDDQVGTWELSDEDMVDNSGDPLPVDMFFAETLGDDDELLVE